MHEQQRLVTAQLMQRVKPSALATKPRTRSQIGSRPRRERDTVQAETPTQKPRAIGDSEAQTAPRPDATPDVKVSRALCLEHQPTAWSKASEQSSASNSINVNPYCAPPSAGHPERWGSGLATRTACDVGCAVYFSQRVYAGTLHTPLSQRPRMNCTRVYAGTLHTPACMVRQRDDYLQLNHRFRAGV